jgi:hypothetical protein
MGLSQLCLAKTDQENKQQVEQDRDSPSLVEMAFIDASQLRLERTGNNE